MSSKDGFEEIRALIQQTMRERIALATYWHGEAAKTSDIERSVNAAGKGRFCDESVKFLAEALAALRPRTP